MWVRVARIGKPFGVKGLSTVQLFTDAPEERLTPGAVLGLDDSGSRSVTIASAQRMGSRWVIGIDGVTDRDAAEELRGQELFAPGHDPVALATDEWFDWQLIGLTCRDPSGAVLGEVVGVEHPPAHDLLVVATEEGSRVRVPFVQEIVPTITSEGVVVDAPGGLFDADE